MWQGAAGRLLRRTLRKMNVDVDADCITINAVNCHVKDTKTKEEREPSNFEIDCCRSMFNANYIKKYQPHLIIAFGTAALYSLIGHRWKKDFRGIEKWRGFTIPDQDLKAWICPVFHPSFVANGDTEMETIWKDDLKRTLALINKPFPLNNEPRINIIKDLSILLQIPSITHRVAFDYETTGIKPHAAGHRVICASVAVSPDNVFVFMMPRKPVDRMPFLKLLADTQIEKMAHNMKFENNWSEVRLKAKVKNWIWDSMIAAHVLDNRPYITGLKFQTYINFGVVDYASDIEPYLRGVTPDNANSLNRIEELIATEAGAEKLMTYCAMDSIWQYRLATKQIEIIGLHDLPF
jgi:uracil-DNA glycosylase family 4